MKVKEFIEKLKSFDENLEIIILTDRNSDFHSFRIDNATHYEVSDLEIQDGSEVRYLYINVDW